MHEDPFHWTEDEFRKVALNDSGVGQSRANFIAAKAWEEAAKAAETFDGTAEALVKTAEAWDEVARLWGHAAMHWEAITNSAKGKMPHLVMWGNCCAGMAAMAKAKYFEAEVKRNSEKK